MSPTRVIVVGLGPAGVDLLLPIARSEISRVPVRFARTGRHPAVVELEAEGFAFETFDAAYDAAADFDSLYQSIVASLLAAATEHGEIVYAVPGNPGVAERTVPLLLAAAGAGVDVTVVPGLSFVDLAWTRLGRDPMRHSRCERVLR